MSKHRAGLQKEVSSIFDGVPIPKENGAEQQINAPVSGHTSDVTAKPAAATIKTARQIPGRQTFEQIKNKLLAPKLGVSATRQKTMVILVPVLFIVFIFVFIRVFSTPSRAVATTAKLEPTDAAASSNNKIDWQIPALYPATLRDPMQFGLVTTAETETETETSRLVVKGIVYSEDKPAVVIGTEILREGEKVLGATIVKINTNSVEFEMNGKKWTQKVQ